MDIGEAPFFRVLLSITDEFPTKLSLLPWGIPDTVLNDLALFFVPCAVFPIV
jgi:hypothetical protein